MELRDSLAKILVAKGHAVVGRDFTAWNGNGRQYDRVLMNPPFEDLVRRMHLRPMGGSGWKVVIINEADRMTPQAEVMWLDGLEKLPAKTVVVFTTNNFHKLTDRFVRRCEVQRFDATSDEFHDGMVDVVRQVWKRETGRDLDRIPRDLGKFERAGDEYSISLALQQIAPTCGPAIPCPPRSPCRSSARNPSRSRSRRTAARRWQSFHPSRVATAGGADYPYAAKGPCVKCPCDERTGRFDRRGSAPRATWTTPRSRTRARLGRITRISEEAFSAGRTFFSTSSRPPRWSPWPGSPPGAAVCLTSVWDRAGPPHVFLPLLARRGFLALGHFAPGSLLTARRQSVGTLAALLISLPDAGCPGR